MRAVIYLRISQDRTGLAAGVDRQREDCEKRCRERGWTIVAIESDNDASAKAGSKKRPGFERLMSSIEGKQADVVVAWAIDRLQRSRRDEVRLYEACQLAGAQLSLVNGADLDFTTAAGRFVADSLGSVARLEIELKSDRQLRAVQQAVGEGRRIGGRRPFGYEADGMMIRESEAVPLRQAYTDVLAGGSLSDVARAWNAQGLTTGQAAWKGDDRGTPSPWRRDSVRRVLLNARNAGLRSHRGEVVGRAVWPSIVPEETWRAVVDVLRHPDRRKQATSARALLTGIARCGVCGSTVHTGGSTIPGHRTYRCRGALGHIGRAAQPVEDYISAIMVARLARADARELLVDRARPDVDEMRLRTVELRARLQAVAVDFADGSLTLAQLRTINVRITSQLTQLEQSMSDAGRVDVLGPLVGADDVGIRWEEMPISHRRAVIDMLAEITLLPPGRGTRTFRPETVVLSWKGAE